MSRHLYQRDFTPDGFEWIDLNDYNQGVISFLRKSADGKVQDRGGVQFYAHDLA